MADTNYMTGPVFNNPPVAEVAVLAQFEPLERIRIKHLFGLWFETEFRERYPEVEEYGELPPFFETFGERRTSKPSTAPRPHRSRPLMRLNLRSPKLDEQFQFQRDRAGFYWQRGPKGLKYPRFPYALESFWRDFEVFDRFLTEHKLGPIRPNQCAVSYNNRIVRGKGWSQPDDLTRVVTFISNSFSSLPRSSLILDDVAAMRAYVIQANKTPVARIYVVLNEASGAPNELDLELVVRGAPQTADRKGMQNFFQMAHDNIVDLFKAVTTPEMHQLWDEQL